MPSHHGGGIRRNAVFDTVASRAAPPGKDPPAAPGRRPADRSTFWKRRRRTSRPPSSGLRRKCLPRLCTGWHPPRRSVLQSTPAKPAGVKLARLRVANPKPYVPPTPWRFVAQLNTAVDRPAPKLLATRSIAVVICRSRRCCRPRQRRQMREIRTIALPPVTATRTLREFVTRVPFAKNCPNSVHHRGIAELSRPGEWGLRR